MDYGLSAVCVFSRKNVRRKSPEMATIHSTREICSHEKLATKGTEKCETKSVRKQKISIKKCFYNYYNIIMYNANT